MRHKKEKNLNHFDASIGELSSLMGLNSLEKTVSDTSQKQAYLFPYKNTLLTAHSSSFFKNQHLIKITIDNYNVIVKQGQSDQKSQKTTN